MNETFESGVPSTASQALRLILAKHSSKILDEPERLTSALADYRPRREVRLLVGALEEGVLQRMVRGGEGTPVEVLAATLKTRLINDRGLSNSSAEWVAQTWFEALQPADRTIADHHSQSTDVHTDSNRINRPQRRWGAILI